MNLTLKCKCCDSVCPVCFDCSVFAELAEPDNEPISVSSIAPLRDEDSTSEAISICSSECSDSGDSCKVTAGEQVSDQKLKENLKEAREMQLKDPLYLSYLECRSLPDDDRVAKRIVLESRRMEITDGVLYREDVSKSGRWYIVVPEPLRQELLAENHSATYAGHLSERKVYNCLRRTYW